MVRGCDLAGRSCVPALQGHRHVCGHTQANAVPLPYACKRFFSVRTGTALASSRLPLKKWVWAIYLEMTSLKGVSSMKLHRDLDVTQTTAWFMLQRVRAAFAPLLAAAFEGPVEADETYVGGLEKNKHEHRKQKAGRGPVGKTAVAGLKDRASGQIRARSGREARMQRPYSSSFTITPRSAQRSTPTRRTPTRA